MREMFLNYYDETINTVADVTRKIQFVTKRLDRINGFVDFTQDLANDVIGSKNVEDFLRRKVIENVTARGTGTPQIRFDINTGNYHADILLNAYVHTLANCVAEASHAIIVNGDKDLAEQYDICLEKLSNTTDELMVEGINNMFGLTNEDGQAANLVKLKNAAKSCKKGVAKVSLGDLVDCVQGLNDATITALYTLRHALPALNKVKQVRGDYIMKLGALEQLRLYSLFEIAFGKDLDLRQDKTEEFIVSLLEERVDSRRLNAFFKRCMFIHFKG